MSCSGCVVGCWLWSDGYGFFVVGCWRLAAGGWLWLDCCRAEWLPVCGLLAFCCWRLFNGCWLLDVGTGLLAVVALEMTHVCMPVDGIWQCVHRWPPQLHAIEYSIEAFAFRLKYGCICVGHCMSGLGISTTFVDGPCPPGAGTSVDRHSFILVHIMIVCTCTITK